MATFSPGQRAHFDEMLRQAKAELAAKKAQPANDNRRFQLIRFKDVQLDTEPTYLIHGVFERDAIYLLWGARKSGKTFWLYDALMHVARGLDYREHKVQQGPVVYVIAEGERGFKKRIAAYRKYHELDEEDPDFFVVPTRFNLVKEHERLIEDIRAQIGDVQPVAIAIDTLNRTFEGSESSDEDMGNYIKAADAVREAFKCAIIIVHHCGLDDTRPRGHTGLAGAIDGQFSCKKNEHGIITVANDFMKDDAEGEEFYSGLEVVTVGEQVAPDGTRLPVMSCVIVDLNGQPRKVFGKPTGKAATAMDILAGLVEREGIEAPADLDTTKRVVRLEAWRAACKGKLATGEVKPDTHRTFFNRAKRDLENAGFIAVSGEWVWLADKADKPGQTQTCPAGTPHASPDRHGQHPNGCPVSGPCPTS